MNVLFIWDGLRPLPAWREAAVKATIDLYPDASYFCISRLRYFVSQKVKIIPWESIADEMCAHFKLSSLHYKWLHPVIFSDWARFWFLAGNPDTLYLDTDAKMLCRYEFPQDGRMRHSPKNVCVLYVPSNFEGARLLDILDRRSKKNFGMLLDCVSQFDPSWSEPLPADVFRHKGKS